ncbi:hypothetical protein [Lonepinella sp. BR2882]|uniref:hypothetical protein n=1 Tax=Lonepinella sp. BR2882 TaxID=3095283 RepID=UPI003F6E2567
MKNDDLKILDQLKEDLKIRTDNAQYVIRKHIHAINDCIAKSYSIKAIYDYIYSENKTTTFRYFENMLYRARKKLNTSQQSTNRSIQEPVKNETLPENTRELVRNNPLFSLSDKEKRKEHDSSSDRKSLELRVQKLLAEQEKQND